MQTVSYFSGYIKRQLGQGMAEYIIIVALIAVAAVGVFTHLGGVIHQQGAAIAVELSGGEGDTSFAETEAGEATTSANADNGLAEYVEKND